MTLRSNNNNNNGSSSSSSLAGKTDGLRHASTESSDTVRGGTRGTQMKVNTANKKLQYVHFSNISYILGRGIGICMNEIM